MSLDVLGGVPMDLIWYSVKVPSAVYEKFRQFQSSQSQQDAQSQSTPSNLPPQPPPPPQQQAQPQILFTSFSSVQYPILPAGIEEQFQAIVPAQAELIKKRKLNNGESVSAAVLATTIDPSEERLPILQLPVALTADYYGQKFEAVLLHMDDESGSRYNINQKGRSGRQAANRIFIMITSVPKTETNRYDALIGTMYDNPSAACFTFQANSEPGWSAFKVKDTNLPLSYYRQGKYGAGFRNHPRASTVHRDLLARQVHRITRNKTVEEIPEISTPEQFSQYRHLTIDQVFRDLGIIQPMLR